jgi:hypothetical protein
MDLKPGPKGNGDTLSSIGITGKQSSRWQRAAKLFKPHRVRQHPAMFSTRTLLYNLVLGAILLLAFLLLRLAGWVG